VATEERLRIIVEAQDHASAALKGVGREADSMGDALTTGIGGSLAWAGVITGAIAAARAVAKVTGELYSAGAAAERLNAGFENMTGGSAPAVAMLGQLRNASRGTIDDMSLIQSANRAMMLGVTKDADTMARLLEVAIARGRNLGVSAQQAFSDIVTGIGRMSPLILDNLGILTGGEQGMSAYAESIGKTSDQLTDMERRQYLVNKVLEDAAVVTNDAAAGMERYAAARANLRAELGMAMAGALPDVPGATADAMQGMADQLRRGREAADVMGEYKDRLIAMQQAGILTGAQLGAMTQQWMILNQQVRDGKMNAEQAALTMLGYFPELAATLAEFVAQQSEARVQIEMAEGATIRKEQADLRAASATNAHAAAEGTMIAALHGRIGAMAQLLSLDSQMAMRDFQYAQYSGDPQGQLAFLTNELKGIKPLTADWFDQLTKIGQIRDQINSSAIQQTGQLRDAQFSLQMAQSDEAGQLDVLRQKLAGLTEGSVEYYQVATQIANLEKSMAKGGASAYKASIAEMRSLAESLLRPTDVSYLDMAQTKLGTYTDKWDEYARRVRAAGNDVKSQWRNLVPLDILAQGEDAIKAWAAAEEEAFYAGQRPDQMNWDAFIENARAEVEKQLSRENMVNEAMQRLADAGIGGMSRVDVAKQFGVADTATVGTDTATQVVQGMTTVDAGKQFTEAFNTQFRAQETRWVEFGTLSVSWFGVGVSNGVASGAADTLINALVPRIQEKLQGRP
jgi:hypothetical protein